ncbi:MAG: RNase adapter RapZ [Gammaproteobacteria bacterium]|jgi:UPF0042 nucleotide-binding protein|nr:RNase adapter RapZ [Gammaproteobacteria bacterium]MBT5054116.1 RNase adapter RapZ [Gammaproteobacteria bacterium]
MTQTIAQLVVISGRSGSGKSTALHVLEDLGYYCIDNLPASLIPNLVERSKQQKLSAKIAVSIDARNSAVDLEDFPLAITKIQDIDVRVIFLDAASPTLIKRFSETRRKHPLSTLEMGLKEALNVESQLLDGLAMMASLKIDTTHMNLHQLRDEVRDRVANTAQSTTIMFQSFAFKHGVPVDADFVFDARFLPNPHWVPHLRPFTGLDSEVAAFLSAEKEVNGFEQDLITFLETWLPKIIKSNRAYITVCVGCTGGQHRSVYLVERLAARFKAQNHTIQTRHKELLQPLKPKADLQP